MIKKIFTGFVAIATIFSMAMSFSSSAVAAETVMQQTTTVSTSYTFNMNLTIGSTGADVIALQSILVAKGFLTMPAGVAMGYFGGLTKAALASMQASVGISPAVGYFGPITRAYFNTHSMTSTSTTTTTTVPGCSAGAMFSSTTGARCDTNTLPAGCTSTSGFSTSTGARCDSTSSTTTTTSGPLHGGAGDITVTERNSGTDDQVLEGDSKTKVLGFEVDPEGSDVSVTSVRVEFEHTGTAGSDRLERYASKVYVMLDNKVVGSADTADFTKNSNVYSRNIPVSGAVVRDADTARFYVAVDAESNIDSNDLGTDFEVAIGSIRFEDATGVVLTNDDGDGIGGAITNTFTFEDLASGGDIKLTLSEEDSDVNDAHTEQISDTSDTNDVDLLSFSLKAKATDVLVNSMAFNVTSSGAGVTEIANDFRLMMGSDEVGNVSVFSGVAGANGDCSGTDVGFASTTDTAICLQVTDLDEDEVNINEGSTENFTLVADVNDAGGAFTGGDSLSVSVDADNVDAEDNNGDQIDSSDLVGSADSGPTSFISTGVSLSAGPSDSSDIIPATNTTDERGKFVVNFDVNAVEDTVWIALTALDSVSATPTTAGAEYYVESPNADDTRITVGDSNTGILERVSGGTIDGNYVKISAGQTATLRLTVTYDPATTGDYRAQLHAVNYAFSKAPGTNQMLAQPTFDYQSPSENVQG